MDANKLAELQRIGYSIPKTCGLCAHGQFPNNEWGTCAVQTYEHLKHTDSRRHLSIVKGGSCPAFSLAPDHELRLGAFAGFLK